MFVLDFFVNRLGLHTSHLGDVSEELAPGSVTPPPGVTGTPIGLLLSLTMEIPA